MDDIHEGSTANKNFGMNEIIFFFVGECLFVTSPTLHADQKTVFKLWRKQSTKSLEEVAIELLTENMVNAIKTKQCGVANSFFVLMGNSHMKRNIDTDLSTLLGKNMEGFIDDEITNLSTDDMKKIILKNGAY